MRLLPTHSSTSSTTGFAAWLCLPMLTLPIAVRSFLPPIHPTRSFLSLFSILEDSPGQVNRVLAERLWQWENEQRQERNRTTLAYSMRSGLRLIDRLVAELNATPDTQSDLIQEGIIALLDAMQSYNETDDGDFETYGETKIRQHLQRKDTNNNGFVTVPTRISKLLDNAQVLLQTKTLTETAQQLQLPVNRLADYLKLRARAVSVETTVVQQQGNRPHFQTLDEWEWQTHKNLDTGRHIQTDTLVSSNVEEDDEGDDQAWVTHTRFASPLPDMIPDPEVTNGAPLLGDEASSFETLNDLVRTTLLEQERQIVKLYFGLAGAKYKVDEIASLFDIDVPQVTGTLESALEKLRVAYNIHE